MLALSKLIQKGRMQKVVFNAAVRLETEKPKQVRQAGSIPANVYIPGKDSIMLKVNEHDFVKLYNQVGESGLIYLEVGEGKQLPALIQEVQIDPITGKYLHVVFRNVSLKEKIVADVPIEFEGEFDVAGGVLVTVRDTLPLEALPTDMPEKIVVNIAELKEIGQHVLLKDIKLPAATVTLSVTEADLETPIVLVQGQKEEVVEEEAPVTVVEGEEKAEGEKAKEETEKSAE